MLLKKVFSGILAGLLFALFALFVVLRIAGIRHYVPISSSMNPAVPKYSLVFMKRVEDASELKVGDVIAFQDGGMPVLHRIKKIEDGTIQTQGDANNNPDAPITFDKVIGKKVFSVPYLGILFGSPYPWMILLALMLIWFLGKELRKEIRKK